MDGHKCKDMVKYCQENYLPVWDKLEDRLYVWTDDTIHLKVDKDLNLNPDVTNTVVWFYDKSTFYAHDHRNQC